MLEFLDKNLKWIALVAISIIILLMLKQCDDNKKLSEKIENLTLTNTILTGNAEVLKDTVKFWKDAQGNNLSSIKILSADKKLLESMYVDIAKKYKDVVGKSDENSRMIAYLQGQVSFRDREISDLKAAVEKGLGSRIINDSTVLIEVGKSYDSLNSYSVTGTLQTGIRDNKIKTGKIDLTTQVNMAIELALDRDQKTSIARITTKTAFPAKITMKGLTQIENVINRTPKSYLGLGLFVGYGATLQKVPSLTPIIGVGAYYSPNWATIKFYKK